MIQHHRRFLTFALCLLVLSLLPAFGCSRKKNPLDSSPEAKTIQQPLPGSDDEIVVHTDDLSLTLADYKLCLALHALKGTHLSERALANPRFQRDEAQRCLQTHFMRSYAKTNHISPTPQDRQKARTEFMRLAGLTHDAALAEKLGVDVTALNTLIDDALWPQTIQAYLVSQLSDGEAFELFQSDYRLYDLEWASFDNEISEAELEAFMASHHKEIKAIYEQQSIRFFEPPHARFIRFGFPRQSDGRDDAPANPRTEQLRQKALEGGVQAARDFCQAHEDEGCVILNDADDLHDVVRSEPHLWAFRTSPGAVSEHISSPAFHEIWILQEIVAPQEPNLQDEAVLRRISREIIALHIPSEALLTKLKAELTMPEADFRAISESLGGTYHSLTDKRMIQIDSPDFIPGDAMRKILKAMKDEEVDLFSDPVVEDKKIFIFRVNRMLTPTHQDYEAHGEAWRQMKSADPKHALVQALLDASMPRMSSLNLRSIQINYGILQPNGSIL
ncbi:MAG: hypothetical protein FWC40_01360 [Proteobacteria bacterium]|nr:hypothetical protein [Pseudomonadota bacterium]